MHVIGEGPQRRHVDDANPVVELSLQRQLQEPVDRGQKGRHVFPLPVGAAISVCSPREMAGQPAAWASVGCSNREANQAATTG